LSEVEIPESWREALEVVAREGGLYLVLGGTDTGKSTFCRLAVEAVRNAGKVAGLVDGDIGQSQYGLPGTVFGLRWEGEERRTVATFFVGTTSPREAALQCLAGICRVTAAVRGGAAHAVMVDTTGYVRGPGAIELKQAKVAALRPREGGVVLIQREGEAEPIVQAGARGGIRVLRLECPAAVVVRSREQRRERRRQRFARYFLKGRPHSFRCAEKRLYTGGLAAFETWLPRESGNLSAAERGLLLQQLLVRHPGLLVGLCDGSGELGGLGLLTVLDATSGQAEMFTPVEAGGYEGIQLGLIRLSRDGEEVGRVEGYGG